MDLFQHRYYKINTMFLSVLGLWPYQPPRRRFAILAFHTFLIMSQIIPQILAVIKFWDDPEVIIQSIPPFVTDLACGTKITNIVYNSDKMMKLTERMKRDWTALVNQPEIEILHDYADIGRVFTVAYMIGMYCCLVLFMLQPSAPKILQALNFINSTGPGTLPFPTDYYGIDMDRYYFYILLHSVICVTAIITVLIAADTMFMVYCQHACGMFSVVGHQLKRLASEVNDEDEFDSKSQDDVAMQYLATCIRKHNEVIEFGDVLKSSYCWAFFSIVGFNMLVMSVTGYQTVVNMDNKPQDAIRYGAFTLAQMLHLFFQSFFSQRLRDHSRRVREYVYQAEWYNSSLCAQKLLSLVIMRTNVPCQLTAGNFITMSLKNFTSIVKTSMSYFTLLRSMQ